MSDDAAVLEEAECLAAIFGDDFVRVSPREWRVTVAQSCALGIFLPPGYPQRYVHVFLCSK